MAMENVIAPMELDVSDSDDAVAALASHDGHDVVAASKSRLRSRSWRRGLLQPAVNDSKGRIMKRPRSQSQAASGDSPQQPPQKSQKKTGRPHFLSVSMQHQ